MGILVNDGNSKPVNLNAFAVAMPVAKHGSHDQSSHGSWAGNGAAGGGSAAEGESEKKEPSSEALTYEKPVQIDWSELGETSLKGNIKTTAGTLDKLFGKGEPVESGWDPISQQYEERKVTEEWTFELKNPKTGKPIKAQIYDFMRYDELGLTEAQAVKLPRMKRSDSFNFSIGAESKADADVILDYIASNTKG